MLNFPLDFCKSFPYNITAIIQAGVLELADETDSKSVDGDIVRVRPPPPAPNPRALKSARGFFVEWFLCDFSQYFLFCKPSLCCSFPLRPFARKKGCLPKTPGRQPFSDFLSFWFSPLRLQTRPECSARALWCKAKPPRSIPATP